MTKAIHYARLSCSKQLPNAVIFIWFADKNLFTLVTLKNSHSNRLYAPAAAKKKGIGAKRFIPATGGREGEMTPGAVFVENRILSNGMRQLFLVTLL